MLIASGRTDKEISADLCITPGTVYRHVNHILGKLGARNRAAIASWVGAMAVLCQVAE